MTGVQAALVYCPFPDRDSARKIAERLLEARLIACANIIPGVESVFEWEGRCSSELEVGVLFKITAARRDALVEKLGTLHRYDTPAVVAWHCDGAHPATLDWLMETTQSA
ncbi:divalent-cation tolerance protein CutA [Erythrobacter sp.]|uniref:divalent-cation tolerance protein CutA n=1 Tax=Erythrobacter sp. TaxID=1042 RepID=UPI003C76026D